MSSQGYKKVLRWTAGVLGGFGGVWWWRRWSAARAVRGGAGGAAKKPHAPHPSGGGGKPPNISGDSAGYNTNLFDSPAQVRHVLGRVGIDVAQQVLGQAELPPVGDTEPNRVKAWQAAYNAASKALQAGTRRINVNEAPGAASGGQSAQDLASAFYGQLAVDGVPGKNTLNSLEISWRNQVINGFTAK